MFFFKSKIYGLGNIPLKCQIYPEHQDFRITGYWIQGILLYLLVTKSTMQKYSQSHTLATFT
jgi:hypothetical protein